MEYKKPYEPKPGEGSAFRNDKKTEDWHAEFQGKILMPNGKTHWLNVDPKITKNGDTFYKVVIGKEVQNQQQKKPEPKKESFEDLPDDLPF